MKRYKNYMVVEIFDEDYEINEWVVADFSDYNYDAAVAFCKAYISRHAVRLEIQGTDEDTDTCVSIETVFIRDLKTETCIDVQELKDKDPRIIKIAMDENLWDQGREGKDGIKENIMRLSTLSGCYDIIQYLLATIEDILNQ